VIALSYPEPGSLAPLWVVLAMPSIAAALNLFIGRRLGRWAGWVASAAVGVSFTLAVWVVAALLERPAESRTYVQHLFEWIRATRATAGSSRT
jgi:NADH:ubiquinone oxidoreductase subunit 5 (subunit L)/multisubunit Na+/H+ antiporter MnhA subunit